MHTWLALLLTKFNCIASHLEKVFLVNGFPESTVRKILTQPGGGGNPRPTTQAIGREAIEHTHTVLVTYPMCRSEQEIQESAAKSV